MTREQKLTEIEQLKQRAAELHSQIVPLRVVLEPLQREWTSVTARRMELEESLVEVTKLPYYGPHKTKPRQQPRPLTVVQAVSDLTSEERRALIMALEGQLSNEPEATTSQAQAQV